jgi:uracil-DNA glycosylase family 4
VPGFGDLRGRLLVLGLAPAAHGGNRTGRVFTGDSSGRFLVRALHTTGFASTPTSESLEDGLTYHDCYVTAAVKCAPPGDRPAENEFQNCSRYMDAEIAFMENLESVLVLGALAFRAYLSHLHRHGVDVGRLRFSHGRVYPFDGSPTLYASYHPSPRNTNTGVLTQAMLVAVLEKIRSDFPGRKTPLKA